MRRRYFAWTWLVLSLVLTIYGTYSIIYYRSQNKGVPVLGWVFFISGTILLVTYLVLALISLIQSKTRKPKVEPVVVEDKKEEPIQKTEQVQAPVVEEKTPQTRESSYRREPCYSSKTARSFDGGSGYVKLVGYGPVLRVENEVILDMQNNTYYRIEGNMVNQSGGGPVFEISGNRIRSAFGGYLYEISGSNVNKVYGGFYASISSGYLQTFDLKEKYEIPTNLNKKQILAVVALLFGTY